jgi:dTDP-3-amino-3,4,6-trideoxy-alpha-D-glucose transaminase
LAWHTRRDPARGCTDLIPRYSIDDFPYIIHLPVFSSAAGVLGVAEFSDQLGFTPRRFYFITDVPTQTVRGLHAHKTLKQCMLCLKGAVTVELEKRGQHFVFRLDSPDQCLIVPPGCWRVIRDFESHNTVVCVLASTEYDAADYIHEYDDFKRWEEENTAPVAVPYLDLARSPTKIEVDAALLRVAGSGRYIGGPEVAFFEQAFAAYCGAAHAVGVGNGLDALALALKARGIGQGDSVVVPVNSFIATALAVSRVGAQAIFVDVEEDTANIDARAAAAAIRADTRAIIPVHLYGHPADIDPLRTLADRYELFLLEDAAQAHGARYRERPCGSLGDAAGFSFYPTKNLGALGDAGAVVSNDAALIRQVRMLANYGAERKDRHVLQGFNSRLDPIQAAVLSVKLRHLDAWNERRRTLAERYRAGLSGLDDLALPTTRPWAVPAWHVFAIRVAGGRRDALRHHLERSGVGSNIHYPTPIHLQPAYRECGHTAGAFPVAERLAVETLSLPLDPSHRDAEIDTVIDAVLRFFH